MEVAWSKVGALRRMLKDFPLEISQRLIRLVGSMGTRVVMQEQQWEVHYFKTVPVSVYVRSMGRNENGDCTRAPLVNLCFGLHADPQQIT
jgi:hypothetical protein